MPEYKNLPPIVYATAWNELYKLWGEWLEQENLDTMDAVLRGVKFDMVDEAERFGVEILRCYPHLASREADKREI